MENAEHIAMNGIYFTCLVHLMVLVKHFYTSFSSTSAEGLLFLFLSSRRLISLKVLFDFSAFSQCNGHNVVHLMWNPVEYEKMSNSTSESKRGKQEQLHDISTKNNSTFFFMRLKFSFLPTFWFVASDHILVMQTRKKFVPYSLRKK